MSAKILYIEDQPDLGFLTKQFLEKRGFDVTWCTTGKSAYEAYQLHFKSKGLIIIDIQLPDISGFDLARRIVAQDPKACFLFLTSRTAKSDRLLGLDLGAVDYIVKPFEIDELVLRIKNLTSRLGNNISELDDHTLRLGDISLDKSSLSLMIEGNAKVSLTIREAELLEYLFECKNKIVRREDLLLRFWGQSDYFLGRSLDVFISRLRKVLRKSITGTTINNVYGIGFILVVPSVND